MSGERGGVAGEVAILTPMLVLLMLFVVVAGRVAQAHQDVTQATAEAARVASLTRTADVSSSARDTVSRNLTAAGVRCRDLSVDVHTRDVRPGGSVRVAVSCTVDLRDVSGPGLPRDRVVRAHAVEVIDTYRGGE